MKGFLGSGPAKGSPVDTLIGRQTEILGDVRFSGGLHVDGRIKGSVTTQPGDNKATLSVSESGVIEGDVRVPHIRLNGTVNGDVGASERLVLAAQARVTGNVHYKVLQMEPGAMINGQLIHEEEPMAALSHESYQTRADSTVTELDGSRRSKSY